MIEIVFSEFPAVDSYEQISNVNHSALEESITLDWIDLFHGSYCFLNEAENECN